MTEEALEKEAKQSYLDNTAKMQWDAEGEFDYTRGYINAAEPREKRIEELEMTVGTLRTFSNEQATSIEEFEKKNAELKEKAKELLNGCIFKARGNVNPSWSELITDIEQFLREIEKNEK